MSKGADTALGFTLAGTADPPLGGVGWGGTVSPVTEEVEAGLAAAGAELASGFVLAGTDAVPACAEDTVVAAGPGADEVEPV